MRLALLLLALVLTFLAVSRGLTATERQECETWQAQEKEYVEWFSPDWAKEQCKQFGISFLK